MATKLELRKKRLLYQSCHRGNKECDILLGRFAEKNMQAFNEEELDQFEALLSENDLDILDWVMQRKSTPSNHINFIQRLIKAL